MKNLCYINFILYNKGGGTEIITLETKDQRILVNIQSYL